MFVTECFSKHLQNYVQKVPRYSCCSEVCNNLYLCVTGQSLGHGVLWEGKCSIIELSVTWRPNIYCLIYITLNLYARLWRRLIQTQLQFSYFRSYGYSLYFSLIRTVLHMSTCTDIFGLLISPTVICDRSLEGLRRIDCSNIENRNCLSTCSFFIIIILEFLEFGSSSLILKYLKFQICNLYYEQSERVTICKTIPVNVLN